MDDNYTKHETVQDGMKIILEIPGKSGDDEKTKQEIREILAGVLRGYIHNLSYPAENNLPCRPRKEVRP